MLLGLAVQKIYKYECLHLLSVAKLHIRDLVEHVHDGPRRRTRTVDHLALAREKLLRYKVSD